MAYQYRISGLPDRARVGLRRMLVHPPMTLPDGRTSRGSDYAITHRVERGEVFAFDAYALNEDYETVEGEWISQIGYAGDKLVEQRFIAYSSEVR